MKTRRILRSVASSLILVVLLPGLTWAEPVGTAFTYQGHLYDANYVANDTYDFKFKLYDQLNDGNQLGSDIDIADVEVLEGYFTLDLDFGSSVFGGAARWLEVGIRPGDLGDPNGYYVLEPRQELTPTPYALYAQEVAPSDGRTYYKNLPPHAFNLQSNETTPVKYEIDDVTGTLTITALSDPYKTVRMVAPVDLPDGATITKLTYFYYDNSSSQGMFYEARLQRMYLPDDLPLSTMAEIPLGLSSTSDTIQSISDTTINEGTIDNQNYMYVLYASYAESDVSSNLAFVGIQIEYTMGAAP